MTFASGGRRSIQLSYGRIRNCGSARNFEASMVRAPARSVQTRKPLHPLNSGFRPVRCFIVEQLIKKSHLHVTLPDYDDFERPLGV